MVDAKDIKFQQFDGRTLLDINDGGFVGIANGATGAGAIRIFEDTDNGSNYVGLTAGSIGTSLTFTLPTADGSSGQFIKTDGSGALSFDTVSSAADDITAGDSAVTIATSSGNITIDAQGSDTDIIFKGTDGSSDITPMTLDMSAGGDLFLTGGLIDLKNDGSAVSQIKFYCESSNAHAQTLQGAPHSAAASNVLTLPSTGGNVDLVSTASTATLTNKTLTTPVIAEIDATGDFTLDAVGDIILDAGGGDFSFKDDGTEILKITNSSSDVIIKPIVDTKDIIFQQRDGTEVARIEDNATFNVSSAGKFAYAGTAVTSTAAELNILDGVTSTASEINLLDGGTSVGSSITLADTDGFVVNDGGTMKTIPASDVKAYSPGGLLNRFINGDMRIDQRYSGTAVTTASGYTLDRWKFQEGGSGNQALSVQRVTDSPAGFAYSAKQTVTTDTSSIAADAYNMFHQSIEGFNWADAGWGASGAKSVTLSFHVKSSIAGNYSLSIRSSNNDRSYVVPYTISSADTWEKITLLIPGPTDGTFTVDNTKTIQVSFNHSMGSNYTSSGNGAWQSESKLGATGTQVALTNTDGATWQVTGTQIEVNPTATSFEYRQLGQELELCQRYYYKRVEGLFGLGFINSTTAMGVSITYPVSMRIAPTALEQTGTAANYQIVHLATAAACSAVPAFGGETSTDATRVTATVGSGLTAGQAGGLRSGASGAYLAWSAEL